MPSTSTAVRGSSAAFGLTFAMTTLLLVLCGPSAWAQAPGQNKSSPPASSKAPAPANKPASTPSTPASASPAARTTPARPTSQAGTGAGTATTPAAPTQQQPPASIPVVVAPKRPSATPPAAGNAAVSTQTAPAATPVPSNLRLRRLEQRVQTLKERAWSAKARVTMLRDVVLGGAVGANATLVHVNNMGSSYRLIKLVYSLDGAQIFDRADDSGEMHQSKEIEIFAGPIGPGKHTLNVVALYRGNGYGVFKYLDKYKFTVRSSHTFTVTEGTATRIEAVSYEQGDVTTPIDKRPAMEFKVSQTGSPGGR